MLRDASGMDQVSSMYVAESKLGPIESLLLKVCTYVCYWCAV